MVAKQQRPGTSSLASTLHRVPLTQLLLAEGCLWVLGRAAVVLVEVVQQVAAVFLGGNCKCHCGSIRPPSLANRVIHKASCCVGLQARRPQ